MDDTWMKPVVRERRHLTQSPIVDVDIHLIVGYGASDLKPSSVPVPLMTQLLLLIPRLPSTRPTLVLQCFFCR